MLIVSLYTWLGPNGQLAQEDDGLVFDTVWLFRSVGASTLSQFAACVTCTWPDIRHMRRPRLESSGRRGWLGAVACKQSKRVIRGNSICGWNKAMQDEAAALHKEMDTDGDGQISMDEMTP